jgi:DNA-binding transcriptional MerR regulator
VALDPLPANETLLRLIDHLPGCAGLTLDHTPGSSVATVTTFATATEVARGLTVATLAARTGVSPDTVRYYERAGLLPPPARTPAGYRIYGEASVDRLHFIQGAQRLGLRLREIRDLLAVRDTGICPCEPAAPLLRWRLAEIDTEISRLTALRAELAHLVEALPGPDCPNPAPGTWQPAGR